MTFQIHALPSDLYQNHFDKTGPAEPLSRLLIADTSPGFPCRVSLEDAAPGERVALIHHMHQAEDTPFQASHAIYVREGAKEAKPAIGAVPAMFQKRTLSLRGFDDGHMMVAAQVVEGPRLAEAAKALFEDPKIAYAHIHFAGPGCFGARMTRAA